MMKVLIQTVTKQRLVEQMQLQVNHQALQVHQLQQLVQLIVNHSLAATRLQRLTPTLVIFST